MDSRSAKYLTSTHSHAFSKLKDINDLLGQAPTAAGDSGGTTAPHRKSTMRASFSLSASMADALASVAGSVTSAINSSSGGGIAGVTPPVSGSPPDKGQGQDNGHHGNGQDSSSSGRTVRFHDDDDDDDNDGGDGETSGGADADRTTALASAHGNNDDAVSASKQASLPADTSPAASPRRPEGVTHHDHPPSPTRTAVDAASRRSNDDDIIDDGNGGARDSAPASVFQQLGMGLGKKGKLKAGDFSIGGDGGDDAGPDLGQGQGQGQEAGQSSRDFFGGLLLNAGDMGLSPEQMETANKHANKIAKVSIRCSSDYPTNTTTPH